MNSADDKPRKALGTGLSALLPGRGQPGPTATAAAPAPAPAAAKPGTLPLGLIQPNPMQPRTFFNSDGLEELAASIRANGIIQPLIVQHLRYFINRVCIPQRNNTFFMHIGEQGNFCALIFMNRTISTA